MIESGTANGAMRPKCQTAIGVVTSQTATVVVMIERSPARSIAGNPSGTLPEPYQR